MKTKKLFLMSSSTGVFSHIAAKCKQSALELVFITPLGAVEV